MNIRTIVLSASIVILLLLMSCQENPVSNQTTSKASYITGLVVDSINHGIPNAIVVDQGAMGLPDTTDATGSFNLKLLIPSHYNSYLIASCTGYFTDTSIAISIDPGSTQSNVNIRLKRNYQQQLSTGARGIATSISLVSAETKNIFIRKTGLKTSSLLTFLVSDSSGNPVSSANKATVKFSLLGGPNRGEFISPDTVVTDINGQVQTTITSGDSAGIVQVVATTKNGSIRSMPVLITISGGFPDANSFSFASLTRNVAGMLYDNLSVQFLVIVGDRFGNPAIPSVVRFTTTGGLITASSTSDATGKALATLTTCNPRPLNGLVYVTASTIGDTAYRTTDSSISKTIPIVFSGQTQIVVPTSISAIPDSGQVSFSYRVRDINGFPIVGGSTITVRVTDTYGNTMAGVGLLGDANVTMEDTQDTAKTKFTVTIFKTNKKQIGGPAIVHVEVNSPASNGGNGNATKTFSILVNPITSDGGSSVVGSQPYSIEVSGSPTTNISVSEGGTDIHSLTSLTFIIRDSLGNSIANFANSGIPRILVGYSLIPPTGLGGGESLMPAIDTVSNSGSTTTLFRAGTKSGIVRVVANIIGSNRPPAYIDITISGGYPDSNRIITTLGAMNLPGLVTTGALGTVSVQMSDQFNNPARSGSKIYFTTSGGQIQPVAQTDGAGFASTTLYGGGQSPRDGGHAGQGHITMLAYGRDSIQIQRTIPFIFSGAPIIQVTSQASDSINVFDGGLVDLTYKVFDANRNPLAPGNIISMSVSGAAASGILLTGDVNNATANTRDTNFTNFHFIVNDAVSGGGPSGDFVVLISVNGPNGSTVKRLYGKLLSQTSIITQSPTVFKASQIAFVSASASDISIAGVGGLENAVITYQVNDSLGNPIEKSPRYGATFNLNFFPNSTIAGGTAPTVIPSFDSTDDRGQLRASIVSGSEAGVVELVTKIDLGGGKMITSQPVRVSVHAGFPAQNHFTFYSSSHFVIPFWDFVTRYSFSVLVGDTFSNPVPAGTAVYFHSQAGVMETGQSNFVAYTNADGMATVNLITGNPFPFTLPYYDPSFRKGCTWLYAQTQSKNGLQIIDSLLVVWNEAPIIITGLPASITMNAHGVSSSYAITVKDFNGNPLTDGTQIGISFQPPSNLDGFEFDIGGNLPATLPNAGYARFPGVGVTDFTFSVVDASAISMSGMKVVMTFTVAAPGIQAVTIKVPITVN